ncbi:MAG: hypothetical protein C0501_23790 [Isosphaera sp.]|nr:hypothetical protein [Isosphaera sp.]
MPRRHVYVCKGACTVRHAVDWGRHDWNTMADEVRDRLSGLMERHANVYVCPRYTVTAPAGVPADVFVKQARRAQILWNTHAKRVLGGPARRRASREVTPLQRQLLFTGFLILDEQQVHPDAWPDRAK